MWWYCWCKESAPPVIYENLWKMWYSDILHINWLAWFLPSTVSSSLYGIMTHIISIYSLPRHLNPSSFFFFLSGAGRTPLAIRALKEVGCSKFLRNICWRAFEYYWSSWYQQQILGLVHETTKKPLAPPMFNDIHQAQIFWFIGIMTNLCHQTMWSLPKKVIVPGDDRCWWLLLDV